jgi:hypothetical protein
VEQVIPPPNEPEVDDRLPGPNVQNDGNGQNQQNQVPNPAGNDQGLNRPPGRQPRRPVNLAEQIRAITKMFDDGIIDNDQYQGMINSIMPGAQNRQGANDDPTALLTAFSNNMKEAASELHGSSSGKVIKFSEHIPKFTGTETAVNAMNWVYQLQLFKDSNSYKEKDFVLNLSNLMVPNSLASQWHETEARYAVTWNDWKEKFTSEYGFQMDQLDEREKEFDKVYQEQFQSFIAYSRKKVTLNQSLGLHFADNILLYKIYQRCSAKYRQWIKFSQIASLKELQDLAKEHEVNEVMGLLEKRGLDPQQHAHVRTVEQYTEFLKAKKAEAVSKTEGIGKGNIQASKSGAAAGKQKADNKVANNSSSPAGGTVPTMQSAKSNEANPSISGGKVLGGFDKATAVPSKVADMVDGCNNGKNVTGYAGDPVELRGYNGNNSCKLCGRYGFNKFLCPYCNTPSQIFGNKREYANARKAEELLKGQAEANVAVGRSEMKGVTGKPQAGNL